MSQKRLQRNLETEETVSYSDTDKPKGSETQLRLNLIPPRQISTLPAAPYSRFELDMETRLDLSPNGP